MARFSKGTSRVQPLFTAMTGPQTSHGGSKRAAATGERRRADAVNVIATFVGVLGRLDMTLPANTRRGG